MTDLVIRPITLDDDFDAQLDLGQRAFGVYSEAHRASWGYVSRLRAEQGLYLGAFVDGAPAGAAVVHDMRQYWVGREVPMAGIASVKVAPEHRGRGIGRNLMAEVLRLVAERGYLLSALYPATMPIYRSLGWELAGGRYEFEVPARSLLVLREPDEAAVGGGRGHRDVPIRRATAADAATVTKLTGDSHVAARDAGPLNWDEEMGVQWLGDPDRYVYLVGDDGFVAYQWSGGGRLRVEHMHAKTPETLRALWAIVASHCTIASTVTGPIAPNDPLWWLTAERDASVKSRPMWMLRVVDAPAAIAARGFPPGLSLSVPLELNDKARPANAGRWQLTVADGAGSLLPNGGVASPSTLALGARGLAALYAGTPVASLRLSGLASGGTSDDDALLNAAFAATPYMIDSF